MWKRKSFHACADELAQISTSFCVAYAANDINRMKELSVEGVEILRILALAIRSEQDYGLVTIGNHRVGTLIDRISDPNPFLNSYQPPYSALSGPNMQPLFLREALNKVAHLNPTNTRFRVSDSVHELLLSGTLRNQTWIAIFSVPDLCDAILAIPDHDIPHQ